MHPFLVLLTLPGLLGGCSDTGVTTFNANPDAEITSHGDGQELLAGYTESFRGVVSDPDHEGEELTATWYLDGEVVCVSAAADPDGASLCEVVVTAEASEITLEVQDPMNAAGSDLLTLSVIPTESPEAEITSPIADGVYYSDQLVTFEGVVADGDEDRAGDLVRVGSIGAWDHAEGSRDGQQVRAGLLQGPLGVGWRGARRVRGAAPFGSVAGPGGVGVAIQLAHPLADLGVGAIGVVGQFQLGRLQEVGQTRRGEGEQHEGGVGRVAGLLDDTQA